jgi:hypothetical protein
MAGQTCALRAAASSLGFTPSARCIKARRATLMLSAEQPAGAQRELILTIRPGRLWIEPLGTGQISRGRLNQLSRVLLLELHWCYIAEAECNLRVSKAAMNTGTRSTTSAKSGIRSDRGGCEDKDSSAGSCRLVGGSNSSPCRRSRRFALCQEA